MATNNKYNRSERKLTDRIHNLRSYICKGKQRIKGFEIEIQEIKELLKGKYKEKK